MTDEQLAADEARARVAPMLAADRVAAALGIEVGVGAGEASATMVVTEDMLNGHGICHGGYVFVLADTAFAAACNSRHRPTVAAGADIAFLARVPVGSRLVATARERALSGRSGLYDVTVRDESGTVVAEFRGRSRAV